MSYEFYQQLQSNAESNLQQPLAALSQATLAVVSQQLDTQATLNVIYYDCEYKFARCLR